MSLQVWLPLNGNVDNQGLASDISVTNNGATIDSSGRLGKCYSFDGTDDYMVFTNPLPSTTTEFSICAWVYKATTDPFVIFNARNSTGRGIDFHTNGSGGLSLDDGVRWDVSNMPLPNNKWVHLCYTRNSSGKKLYFNGILQSSTTTVGTISNGWYKNAYIGNGAANDTLNEYSKGKLNDLRIYDNCLSQDEIRNIVLEEWTITPGANDITLQTAGTYADRNIIINGITDGSSVLASLVDRSIVSYTNNNVTVIGAYAFAGCESLTEISLLSIQTVGTDSFLNCHKLTSISLPVAATIYDQAFFYCGVKNLSLPAATSIGNQAFYSVSGANITIGTNNGGVVCSYNNTNSTYDPKNCKIYVPSSLLTDYQEATNWSRISSQLVGI